MLKKFVTGIVATSLAIGTGNGAVAADPVDQNADAAREEAKPVAAFYMRASVVPRPEDLAPLQQGLALMIASSQGGMTIVEYRISEGKIVYTVTSGAISEKDRKAIEKAVAKLQKKL